MWHEARRQERKIRGMMVDYKRRAERRRDYYERIKADPSIFLRVYGRPAKINLDPAVAIAAESPKSMMPWQGDTSNMIDRFDVRSSLDIIPEYKRTPSHQSEEEEKEEHRCNYERYRTLVQNEYDGVTQEQWLHQLHLDEQFGATDIDVAKEKEEEKKKLAVNKAAIGFTYEDSTPVEKKKSKKTEKGLKDDSDEEESSSGSDSDSDSDLEFDLDINVDVDELTQDQIDVLNSSGTMFGLGETDYIDFLKKDKRDTEEFKLAKMVEEEKAQFSGRKSRRERRAYKEKQLMNRKFSPPSYAARDSPEYKPYNKRASKSRSRSRSYSPPRANPVYITSFGHDSDGEGGGIMQGPCLPNQIMPVGPQLPNVGPQLPKVEPQLPSSAQGPSLPENNPIRSRLSRSRSRNRSRSRSWSSRSSSRSRSRSRSYSSRSRSRSYSRSRSRSRNRSRSYRRSHSRSRTGRSRSRDRYRRSRSRDRYRYSRSRSRSRSREKKVPIKRYRRPSLSSGSDNEVEVSSYRDRQLKTNTDISKSKPSYGSTLGIKRETSDKGAKLTHAEKLKRKMQAALNKQYKSDKKTQEKKVMMKERQRMDREDEIRSSAMEMRKRERERRHRDALERERLESEQMKQSHSENRQRKSSPR
ncbi:unnamed protein product, partial [Owenia fusiformis]